MSSITLGKALSVLAKSSPFSVTTVTERPRDVFDDFKDQLFVQQDIESDLQKLLAALSGSEIIFLCGSSGDGKSEILTRSFRKYRERFIFHLDATHSFTPHQSAIEALDELFDRREAERKPLIVGINTGMLANYSKEGAPRHNEIKYAIEKFLGGEIDRKVRPCKAGGHWFLDFEQYPKFQFDEQGTFSLFAKALITKLTRRQDDNLFFQCACADEAAGRDLQVVANFKLLGLPCVQEAIITQLFKVRLIKDQFVTTRALLDLLHHLLLGPAYLFDNLYVGEENELVKRLTDFDPARIHTQELDQFALRYELGLPDQELENFVTVLRANHIFLNREEAQPGEAGSLIRLFSLLRDEDFGNNYHHKFKSNFKERLLEQYAFVWRLHNKYNGSQDGKLALRKYYTNELVAGIQRYANRNAPELSLVKNETLLGSFGGIRVTAPVELKGDYEAILQHVNPTGTQFFACLKIDDKPLLPIPINLNLFELLHKLNHGYRPNKYDKNAIVMLDEIIDHVTDQAKESQSLKFYENGRSIIAKVDDGMIAISGMGGNV